MQDDRGQLERFTHTVKVLMVVDAMQENDASAEVPGVGTSGTCSFGPKRLDRLFSCTANALPGFLAFKMRWRRPRKSKCFVLMFQRQRATLRQCVGRRRPRKRRPNMRLFVMFCLSGRRPQVERLRADVRKARQEFFS